MAVAVAMAVTSGCGRAGRGRGRLSAKLWQNPGKCGGAHHGVMSYTQRDSRRASNIFALCKDMLFCAAGRVAPATDFTAGFGVGRNALD